MIKLRNAYYCNLKLILIWLVIFAHWIEPQIRASTPLLHTYRWIYLVHMPLFSFLSGLFLRSSGDCLRQLRRTLPLYGICQGIAVVLGGGAVRWDTPWWHLWYLLSLSCWLVLAAAGLKLGQGKWAVLLLSLTAGCLAGQEDWLGRSWSLSRTVVFFPYFWLGTICKPDIPWHRFRLPGLIALGIAVLSNPWMSVTALYHAAPCDPMLRLECYGYGLLLGLFLLSWCPRRRFPWTRAGADTMPAYLLHGPIVRVLRQLPLSHLWLWTTGFVYLTYKAVQWRGGAFGITGRRVRHHRKGGGAMAGFEELYETQGKPVYRFLLSLTGDEAMAEELLQETFYQAFLHIDRFEGRSSLYTWLCCIGKNAWLRECRRRSRYADIPYEDLRLEDPAPSPESKLLRQEQGRQLRRAVLRVKDPQREVFILHCFGGLKLKEIAALHQKSESWARISYFRARKAIMEVLTNEMEL